jgi:hypothetical protein
MVIRRIGVWSVARLYGAMSASAGLLLGCLFAIASTLGGFAGAMRDSAGAGAGFGMLGMMFGVGAIVFLPLLYGVLGVVTGALAAALYNLFAGMFGGIELETEP